MASTRTRTVKNKHAAKNSGIAGSKNSRKGPTDGVVKTSSKKFKAKDPATQVQGRLSIKRLLKKKQRTFSEKELDIPQLNTVTPVGVQKPKGKKKGKVFVDDRESMNTIMAIVQAEMEGQIESKMMKARQLEEIREARRIETEKKDTERRAKLEETKDSLRKKRRRKNGAKDDTGIMDITLTGTKATKPKKKRVSFAT